MNKTSKRVSPAYVIGHILTIAFCSTCLLPFVLLISASFTEEYVLIREGYKFWPSEFSLEAYKYLGMQLSQITRAYGITIFITVAGTAISLALIKSPGIINAHMVFLIPKYFV